MIDPNSIIDAGKVVDDYIKELKKKISDLEKQLEENEKDIAFLECLRAAGVDNWDGYDEAIQMMKDNS